MTMPGHPQATTRRALLVGGLLLVLAGLFGMHGLDSHGATSMEAMPDAVMTGPGVHADAIDGSLAHDPVPVALVANEAAAGLHADTGMTIEMAMTGMCLAVLAIALIVLLRLLRTSPTRPVLWVFARPIQAPGFRARDLDPPSLIALSIQRC